MGSSPSPSSAPSAAFLAAFRTVAGPGETLRFDEFMDLALYHPTLGYYRREGARVGYGAGTDFFTSSTSGPIFGELIVAACATLLAGRSLRDFTFVEIGAEPSGGILAGVKHPFARAETFRVGDPVELTGNCVVFSNELFDAQPFRRFIFKNRAWRELGVAVRETTFVQVALADSELPPALPSSAPEDYVIDAPLAAAELARQIASQRWSGLFLACDYGKSWAELIEATPSGTARAYFQHTQSNELLARPGEQDLTCHVCWDWLDNALRETGFAASTVESQESFFIKHAGKFIEATTAAEAAHFSRKKLSLLQLLHPSHLGQKFQVLHARRI